MKILGKHRSNHSTNQIKSPNTFYKRQVIFLCKKVDGRTLKRICIVETGSCLSTKTTNRKYILCRDLNKSRRKFRVYMDLYSVEPYSNCLWDQTHWIES